MRRPGGRGAPDRTDRPDRTEGATRSDGSDRSSRERPPRSERTGAPRAERGNRDPKTDRRPNASSPSIAKKPSGFGAGIRDDDSFGFVDDVAEVLDSFEPAEEVADAERESRPRRRRSSRSRRPEPRTREDAEAIIDPRDSDADRDIDDEDSGELVGRHSKIPSWQDAIGTLVETNMENHQRSQSQNRGPRGRGPRRDR